MEESVENSMVWINSLMERLEEQQRLESNNVICLTLDEIDEILERGGENAKKEK